jgi:hypothetical protein
MELILSRPAALLGLSFFSSSNTPGTVMFIAGICGVRFGDPSLSTKPAALTHNVFSVSGFWVEKADLNSSFVMLDFVSRLSSSYSYSFQGCDLLDILSLMFHMFPKLFVVACSDH